MRLAWFAPPAVEESGTATDSMGLLVRALRARHAIDLIDARAAHDFVWQHARMPYDLCIYELDDTRAHQFIWPYLIHYPGITRLHRLTLQTSRAAALERERRLDDFAREFSFAHPGATPPMLREAKLIAPGRWSMLAIPLLASRITVVGYEVVMGALAADYPGARVRAISPGVEPLAGPDDGIVVSLEWPVNGAPLTRALAGLAAGRPVVVFDCPETADWPSINPQDWRPRSSAPPICVAIDPRDEDHSRRLAMRRLEEDVSLRRELGSAARAWWLAHATVERAVAGFEEVLEEGRKCEPPARPPNWPAHLSSDGFAHAREVLSAFGVELPF
jgi:hypothetical protein